MRKFLAVLMAVFMLTAALAVLPASAATTSTKDGSTVADAQALDLVVTEVLADTMSHIVTMASKNAFQYIEIHNRGSERVNVYDYAIVRAAYNERSATPWADPKKFDGKIVLDVGSIYEHYIDAGVNGINAYMDPMYACVNADDGWLEAGATALIWIWNKDTKDAFGTTGTTGEKIGNFVAFREHYKAHGVEIPADVKIFATFGVTGVGQSFELNTTNNFMYALVKDGTGSANTFDIASEIAYRQTVGDFERNADIVCMWEHGTGLGLAATIENYSVIYTTADNTPRYLNAYYEESNANYYAAREVDSFKQLGAIRYEERMTPGVLLPIQWADIDPDRAPASVKGTDANWQTTVWNTYIEANTVKDEGINRPEEDLNQDEINVDRDNLGNRGQNKLGEWTNFIGEDGKYYRYKTEGGSVNFAVEVTKAEYDAAMAALAESENGGNPSEPDWDEIVKEFNFFIENGKYYAYPKSGSEEDAEEISKDQYDAAMEALARAEGGTGTQSGSQSGSQSNAGAGTGTGASLQIAQSVIKGDWVYCVSNDGKYYKYQANGGSLATAVEIAKAEYDQAVNSAEDEEKEISSIVWVLIAVGGAVVLVGIGVLLLLNFMKNKNDQTDEELSADENDGFSS